jgi:predicted transcriptional regulator
MIHAKITGIVAGNLGGGATVSTELSPDKDQLLEKLVADGRFPTRQQALDRAVDLLREEADAVEEIRDGLNSIERGEGMPSDDLVRSLLKAHYDGTAIRLDEPDDLPRDAQLLVTVLSTAASDANSSCRQRQGQAF